MNVYQAIEQLSKCQDKEAELVVFNKGANTYTRINQFTPTDNLKEFPHGGDIVEHSRGWVEKGLDNFQHVELLPIKAYIIS